MPGAELRVAPASPIGHGADNDRPMNLPSRGQGLANNRQALHDAWGQVDNAKPLTQSLGARLKKAGL